MSKLFLVMPAYNEADNIEKTVRQWCPVVKKLADDGVEARLVVANDGSKDATLSLLQGLTEECPQLIPLDKANGGHGETLLFLYRYAMENGAEYVFQTDSDGQTSPDEFWPMWERREDFDFQIGHRKGRQDGVGRVFVASILKFIVWLMFGVKVKDANTPFRLMHAEKLKPILEVMPRDFFLCNVAIAAIAVKWNYKIGWQPISFKPRQGGVNSVNWKKIVRIGWSAWGDFNRMNKNLKKKNV